MKCFIAGPLQFQFCCINVCSNDEEDDDDDHKVNVHN